MLETEIKPKARLSRAATHGAVSLRRAWSLLCVSSRRRAAWRSLTEGSADLIVVLDAGLTHLHASPGIHEMFGRDAAGLSGRPALHHVHPDDRPALAAALSALPAGAGDPRAVHRFRVRHADGRLLWVEAKARRLDGGGEIVLSVRDISSRLQGEVRRSEAAALHAVGEIAAGVAHDFNNLLTVILGNLEMLEESAAGADSDCIHAARQAAQRAAALTRDLLAYAGLQALRPGRVDAAETLGDLQLHFRGLLAGLPVGIDVEPGLPPLQVDRVQLRAALVNLALDAVRRAEPGAGLCLEAYSAEGSAQDGMAAGAHVVIAVTDAAWDTSPCDIRPRPAVPGHSLAGLGVAAARGFARRSGGDLLLTGMAGIGTRAEIWLPVCAAPASVRAETA